MTGFKDHAPFRPGPTTLAHTDAYTVQQQDGNRAMQRRQWDWLLDGYAPTPDSTQPTPSACERQPTADRAG